jgi:hypothetical protein
MSESAAVPSSSSSSSPPPVTREELVELIQAIRFAKPEVSQRQVHREITQDLSKKEGFQFLNQVEFKQIQKAWKQAMKEKPPLAPNQQQQQQQTQQHNADLLQQLQSQNQPPELFTIGQNNNPTSLQFLAQEYTAAQKLAETTSSTTSVGEKEEVDDDSLYKNYVHVFLDVPHDKTGSRPHEALIHFQKPTTTTTTTTTAATKTAESKTKPSSGNNKKKSNKKKTATTTTTATTTAGLDEQGRMIVKIQRAAPIDAHDTTKHPLLLYNETRTCKTFIHPDEGYDRIVEWMDKEGQTGVLGITGGAKAYYYARLTLAPQKGHPNILSIDVTQLAPPQEW